MTHRDGFGDRYGDDQPTGELFDRDSHPFLEPRPRRPWGVMILVAFAVISLAVGVGAVFTLLDKDERPVDRANFALPPASVEPSVEPSPEQSPTAGPPSPSPKASPSRSPATVQSPKVKVSPSRNPAKAAEPAPPAPPAVNASPGCVTRTVGPAAAHPAVRAALKAAAERVYWKTSAPTIKVPERLLIAIAFTESSWRSNVISCDGGIGLMQVMPDTVTMLNQRFGTSWDVNTVEGNAYLGGQYLAWSIKYLGDLYFAGDYDLSNQALFDSVIAAYNYGAGAVNPTKGEAGIPNWPYVNRVKQYQASCPCDAY